MPRIPVPTMDSAAEQTHAALRHLQERMGKLLNVHAAMAHSPVVLAAYGSSVGPAIRNLNGRPVQRTREFAAADLALPWSPLRKKDANYSAPQPNILRQLLYSSQLTHHKR